MFDIFTDDKFSKKTRIKKFDASAILNLLNEELLELSQIKELKWESNRNSIPNNNWLKQVWSVLFKSLNSWDFARLCYYSLLPVTYTYDVLVRPDITNPLLYLPENGHILCSVLVKLQVRFTKFIIPETANENLKKCIVKCTPITIVNSLERTCSLLSLTMNQLFEKANLLPSDYEKFRTFLKQEFKVLTGK